MKIKVLVENTSISKDYLSEHGLCLYIETKAGKILFDLGASSLFLENAKGMGVNIADVDYLVISHGHYDHCGGLRTFLRENTKAGIFIHQQAFERFYSQRPDEGLKYIGPDQRLRDNERIVFVSAEYQIDNDLWLFQSSGQKKLMPRANKGLLKREGDRLVEDDFLHEQNLVIRQKGKTLLLTGCAHVGIVNILDHYKGLQASWPDYVIGGFHLSRPGIEEEAETIDRLGERLLSTGASFYTCHCTGMGPYQRLENIMGDRLAYLSTGSQIIL